MNSLLENKILEEINNTENKLVVRGGPWYTQFDLVRGDVVRISLLNGWGQRIWKLKVADKTLFDVDGSRKAFDTHNSRPAYLRILRALELRRTRENTNGIVHAYESELSRMTKIERAAFDALTR